MIALGELAQDALTEIFSIGVGLAAHALYQMTGQHVALSVPVVELTRQDVAELGNINLNAVVSELATTLGLRLEGSLPTVGAVHADGLFTRLRDFFDAPQPKV